MLILRGATALLLSFAVAASAHAASCRTYQRDARDAISHDVIALVRIESKLSTPASRGSIDKAGLSREARALARAMFPDQAATDEAELAKCRNFVPPVRRTCSDAAARLAAAIDQGFDRTSDAGAAYTKLITRCETWLSLAHPTDLPRAR